MTSTEPLVIILLACICVLLIVVAVMQRSVIRDLIDSRAKLEERNRSLERFCGRDPVIRQPRGAR